VNQRSPPKPVVVFSYFNGCSAVSSAMRRPAFRSLNQAADAGFHDGDAAVGGTA
jgi:hypothetical protein